MKAKHFHLPGLVLSVQFPVSVLLAGLLTGCIDVNRTLVPPIQTPYVYKPITAPAKGSLEVTPVQDNRPAPVADSQPLEPGMVLVSKETSDLNGHVEVEIYYTKRPLAEMFRDALNLVLQRNGFETTNGTQYALESEITSTDYGAYAADAAVWKSVGLSPLADSVLFTITVNFELKDKATGQSVWKQTYHGNYQATTGLGDGQFFARICSMAVEDAARQLITDEKFRSYFETQGTNAP
jgi:Lipopolysaccharide-assembly